MVGHCVGPGKYGAGLAVFALAVAEEKGVAGGVAVSEAARLAHEAAGEHHSVGDRAAFGNDEVFADDTLPQDHGRFGTAVQGALGEPQDPFQHACIPDAHVAYAGHAGDAHAPADMAAGRAACAHVSVYDCIHLFDEIGSVAVEGYHIGLMGREAVVDDHLAAAGLIEHGHFDAIAEAGLALGVDIAHIIDQAIL